MKTLKSSGASRDVRIILASVAAAGLAVALGGGLTAAVAASDAPDQTDDLEGMYQVALEGTDPSAPTYEMLEKATTEGEISVSDYETVHEEYAQCIRDNGFDPSFRKTDDGVYVELPYTNVKDAEALDRVVIACSADAGAIEALYNVQVSNPGALLDGRAVAVDCLAEKGYVDSGYSAEQFEHDLSADTFPFDPVAVGANDCLYGAGYAYFDLDQE